MGGVDRRGVRRHHRDPARVGVLRAAWASPQTSKRLKLRCESSARFERGIDPDARRRATPSGRWSCCVEVAGAQVAPDAVDEYPAPVERARITLRTSRVNAVLGTDARRRGRVGRRWRRSASSSTRPTRRRRRRRRWSRSCPRSAPTSSARSTSSRRSRAASASTRSAARCPTPTGRSAGSRVRQQERRAGRRRAGRASGCSRGDHAPAGRRPPTSSAAGAPLDRIVRGHEPAAGRGVGAAHRGPPRPARGGRRQPRRRGCADVALFELGRVFLTPAAGRRRQPAARRARARRASCWPAPCAARPVEADRPVDVVRRGRRAPRGRSTRSASHDVALESPTPLRATAPVAARAVVVDGDDVGTVGEVAPDGARRRSGSTRRWSPLELDARRAARRAPGATARSARRRASRRRPSTSRSCSPTRCRPPACSRRCAARSATRSRTCGCFDVFRSDALGAGRRSLAFALRFRAARSHAHRRRGRRAAPAGDRRRDRRARRRAPGLSGATAGQCRRSGAPGTAPQLDRSPQWQPASARRCEDGTRESAARAGAAAHGSSVRRPHRGSDPAPLPAAFEQPVDAEREGEEDRRHDRVEPVVVGGQHDRGQVITGCRITR